MTFLSKIRWVASILLVFLIVLITNIIDRKNFNELSNSVTTIYEDRIVASDLIFEISRLMQHKRIAAVTNDADFFQKKNNTINGELSIFFENYQQTKLTDQEEFVFDQLQDELKTLGRLEQNYNTAQTEELLKSLDEVDQYLYDLSKIQMHEGRRQVLISDKAIDTLDLFTRGEIVFLIIMAILVQVIILYKPRETVDG